MSQARAGVHNNYVQNVVGGGGGVSPGMVKMWVVDMLVYYSCGCLGWTIGENTRGLPLVSHTTSIHVHKQN